MASITMVASDAPYGHFAFSQEQLWVLEEVQKVCRKGLKNLRVIFAFDTVNAALKISLLVFSTVLICRVWWYTPASLQSEG